MCVWSCWQCQLVSLLSWALTARQELTHYHYFSWKGLAEICLMKECFSRSVNRIRSAEHHESGTCDLLKTDRWSVNTAMNNKGITRTFESPFSFVAGLQLSNPANWHVKGKHMTHVFAFTQQITSLRLSWSYPGECVDWYSELMIFYIFYTHA